MCIGPVNKTINMLACWFENPDGDAFKRRALHLLPLPSAAVMPLLSGASCDIHAGHCHEIALWVLSALFQLQICCIMATELVTLF